MSSVTLSPAWLRCSWRMGLTLALAVAATPWAAAQTTTFGGIELASSSIKGLTFTFQPGAEASAAGGQRSDRMRRLQYAERNASFISTRDGCKLSPKGLDLLIKDTKDVLNELREGARVKGLGNPQFFEVGSSGLGDVCNTDEIISRVQAETGLCMEFISASDEARYSLGFVLPKDRYRSMILDIGSGNTKAGYYIVTKGAAWPPKEWHGLEIAYGSRTLRDKALALSKSSQKEANASQKPALDFYQAVDAVLQNEVLPKVQEAKMENEGLQNFRQVYMVGGVIWATSTREKPVEQEEWAITSISPSDFGNVLVKIKDGSFNDFDGSEFGPQVSAATKENAENDLRDVLQRFDPQSLYAGVSLARFIVAETTPNARLLFPTTAAWISGYAREKFKESGKTVPTCSASTGNK